MAPTFRGPIPTVSNEQFNTAQFNEIDTIYWPGMEIDPEFINHQRISPTRSQNSSRQYIDPWDLENYDYIRRNMEDTSDPSLTTPSPAGEPISSTFYYVPGDIDDVNPTCYAGLDEKSFYNEKLADENEADTLYSASITDIETSSGDRNSSCGSTVSTLHLHTPGFGVASGQRRIVLPKPPPSIEFPGPPSYEYYEIQPSENNYCSLNDCYECINGTNVPLYDTLRRNKGQNHNIPPNHFSLSKKGLLQIDYSCNWNNLDRYIGK